MRITIESTDTTTTIEGAPCRLWEGVTESGAKVWVFVTLISADADQEDTSQLDRELTELREDAGDRFVPVKGLHRGEPDRCPEST